MVALFVLLFNKGRSMTAYWLQEGVNGEENADSSVGECKDQSFLLPFLNQIL